MTTYGLVHGAWQAAWHWHLVVGELEHRGHQVLAIDLPCDDPDAGAAEYADILMRELSSVDDDLVLVGHFLGGLTIPIVALHRPVRRLVFLTAMIPVIGRSADEQTVDPDGPRMLMPDLGAGQIRHGDGSSSWRPEAALGVLYPDAPPDLAAVAAERLRRQQWRPIQEITPLPRWPDVESQFVVCAADAVMNPAWARCAAAERLGVTADELPGDHSPFLARPAALVDLIVRA